FLASFLLVIVGLWIRLSVDESPAFKKVTKRDQKEKSPLMSVLRQYRKQVILMAGAYLVHGVVIYGAAVYSLSYGTNNLNFRYTHMFWLFLLCQVVVLA